MNQGRSLSLCLLCASLAWVMPAAAQAGNDAPGADANAPKDRLSTYIPNTPEADGRPGQYYYILGAQAFKRGEYSFAINMYQVAASWAYKPAQFNLGVMYARGQGIPVDLPRAMAWMTLAAERKDPGYLKARELVRSNLQAGQLAESEEILQQLTPRYGDKVALRRAKNRWAQVRSSMTGSRVGSMAGNMVSGTPAAGPATPDPLNSLGQGIPVTAAQAAGGQSTDGSMAYQALVSSDNPYDTKFMTPIATATVGPLVPVKGDEKVQAADGSTTSPAADPGH